MESSPSCCYCVVTEIIPVHTTEDINSWNGTEAHIQKFCWRVGLVGAFGDGVVVRSTALAVQVSLDGDDVPRSFSYGYLSAMFSPIDFVKSVVCN